MLSNQISADFMPTLVNYINSDADILFHLKQRSDNERRVAAISSNAASPLASARHNEVYVAISEAGIADALPCLVENFFAVAPIGTDLYISCAGYGKELPSRPSRIFLKFAKELTETLDGQTLIQQFLAELAKKLLENAVPLMALSESESVSPIRYAVDLPSPYFLNSLRSDASYHFLTQEYLQEYVEPAEETTFGSENTLPMLTKPALIAELDKVMSAFQLKHQLIERTNYAAFMMAFDELRHSLFIDLLQPSAKKTLAERTVKAIIELLIALELTQGTKSKDLTLLEAFQTLCNLVVSSTSILPEKVAAFIYTVVGFILGKSISGAEAPSLHTLVKEKEQRKVFPPQLAGLVETVDDEVGGSIRSPRKLSFATFVGGFYSNHPYARRGLDGFAAATQRLITVNDENAGRKQGRSK